MSDTKRPMRQFMSCDRSGRVERGGWNYDWRPRRIITLYYRHNLAVVSELGLPTKFELHRYTIIIH